MLAAPVSHRNSQLSRIWNFIAFVRMHLTMKASDISKVSYPVTDRHPEADHDPKNEISQPPIV